jgi:hypothetical protein
MNSATRPEKAAALVFALVLSAVLLELGLRAWGPGYDRFSNAHSEYFSNPRGYFDQLWDGPEGPVYGIMMNTGLGIGGRRGAVRSKLPERVLMLGDSQAQGQGVRHADLFSTQLQDGLAARGVDAGVRNVAVSGYDLEQVVARYAYETSDGSRFPVVVYAMVLDDFGLDRSQIEGLDLIQHQAGYTHDPLRERSAIYNLVQHTAEQAELSRRTTRAYLQSYSGDNLREKMQMLQWLDRQVSADGGVLITVILPLLYDLQDYPFEAIHLSLAEQAEQRGMNILDLRPALAAHDADALWVHPTDHHPNELAHRIVGQVLLQHLESEDLLGAVN